MSLFMLTFISFTYFYFTLRQCENGFFEDFSKTKTYKNRLIIVLNLSTYHIQFTGKSLSQLSQKFGNNIWSVKLACDFILNLRRVPRIDKYSEYSYIGCQTKFSKLE